MTEFTMIFQTTELDRKSPLDLRWVLEANLI